MAVDTPLLDEYGRQRAEKKPLNIAKEFSEESKRLWIIAGPAIFTAICQYSLGALTQTFAGLVGELELAAVSVENSVISGLAFGAMMVRGLHSASRSPATPTTPQTPTGATGISSSPSDSPANPPPPHQSNLLPSPDVPSVGNPNDENSSSADEVERRQGIPPRAPARRSILPNYPKTSDGRLIISIARGGKSLYPSEQYSRLCRRTFRQRLEPEGYQWKNVSAETVEFYWQEFLKLVELDNCTPSVVRGLWLSKARGRYRDFISKIKMKGQRQSFISESIWARWTEYWQTPEALDISRRQSRNRLTSVDGAGPSTHTGGSIPHSETIRRLSDSAGEELSAERAFVLLHTKNHDGRTFIDGKSQATHQRFLELKEQSSQSQESVDENSLYLQAAGGSKKGRIYGLGSQASHYYASSSRAPSPSTPVSNEQTEHLLSDVHNLKQDNTELRRTVAAMQSTIDMLVRHLGCSPAQPPPDNEGPQSSPRTNDDALH